MTSSFTADDGGRTVAIVRRMKKLREDLQDGEIGELTFLFEYGALERARNPEQSPVTDGAAVVTGSR
jgi:hypothetical protein